MGYQISYGQTIIKTPIKEKKSFRINKRQRTVIITALLLAAFLAVSQWKGFQDALLPGDNAITRKALSGMISVLREGEPVGKAVRAFCQEIVDNAQIPQ